MYKTALRIGSLCIDITCIRTVSYKTYSSVTVYYGVQGFGN
jgi:hypothetical protein